MKKIALISAALVVASSSAMAGTVCTGTAGKFTVAPESPALFVKTNFQTPCSNKVLMDVTESSTAAWVAAGSTGGACWQIGHTDAGVRPMTTTCSPASPNWTTPPTAVDAAALTAAAALGSS
jgi:hypothetical protein